MSKHPLVYEDGTVKVYLELFQNNPFIHVISKEWSKSTIEHYTEVFVELCEQLKTFGYTLLFAAILPEDEKLKRFAGMFGFEETDYTILDDSSKERMVYKCCL